MIDRGKGGSIMNITSAFAQYPSERVQNYNAAKVGLDEMMNLWAVELGPYKIRVNAICPGTTRSATVSKLLTSPEAEAEAAESIPLSRLGEPSDMGKCGLPDLGRRSGSAALLSSSAVDEGISRWTTRSLR